MPASFLAKTPEPPYYAVIFTSQRTNGDRGYEKMAERMVALAAKQLGFLGVESVRDENGFGITVSYWSSEEAIAAWKAHADHKPVQEAGKATWYADYQVRVAKVERASGKPQNTALELHDSTVFAIQQQNGTVAVHFCSAYLHRPGGRPGIDPGSGWLQEARLVFENASVTGNLPVLPCDILDGVITVDGNEHENTLPVPFEITTPVELRITFDEIHSAIITGKGGRLELLGEPRYIEDFR